jgi:hypothetical protein
MRLPNDDFFMTRVLTAMYHFGNNLRSKLHKSAVRLPVPNAAPARAEPAHADESPSDSFERSAQGLSALSAAMLSFFIN